MPSNLENALRRAVDLNVRLYADLARLGLDYLRDMSETLRDLRLEGGGATRGATSGATRTDVPAARVLVLDASAGTTATGEFAITNHLRTVVSTRIATTPFLDATGHEADVRFDFEPDEIDLQPGEQVLVRVKARIGEGMRPAATYRGEFTVPDLGSAGIPVAVRRHRDRT